jgi:uronate dehydrogenase
MKLLVTGASGWIGTAFVASCVGGPFDVVRSDVRPGEDSPFPFTRLDVTDAAACREACEGVDAVLHLAADPAATSPFLERVLPLNIVGTFNMVEAAIDAGVGRFVFASSAQAVEGYPLDHQIRETDAPRPANDYGVGKAFGEALCASRAGGPTSFVALRIAFYNEQPPPVTEPLRQRMAWLSPRDANHLLERSLTAPVTGYTVGHGTSDNASKRLSLAQTRDVLGYAPQDDAFAER